MATVKYKDEDDAMRELNVSVDNIEFDSDEEINGYVSQEKLNNEIIPNRLKRERKKIKDKLSSDEDFIQNSAKTLGIDTHTKSSELKSKAAQADKWKNKVSEMENELNELRDTSFENEILKSEPNFDPSMSDVAKDYIKDQFTYDDENSVFVKQDGDGDIEYGSDGQPVGVSSYLERLRNEKPGFFKNRSVQPSNTDKTISNGSTANGKKVYTKDEYENIRDNGSDDEWKAAKDALMDGRVKDF